MTPQGAAIPVYGCETGKLQNVRLFPTVPPCQRGMYYARVMCNVCGGETELFDNGDIRTPVRNRLCKKCEAQYVFHDLTPDGKTPMYVKRTQYVQDGKGSWKVVQDARIRERHMHIDMPVPPPYILQKERCIWSTGENVNYCISEKPPLILYYSKSDGAMTSSRHIPNITDPNPRNPHGEYFICESISWDRFKHLAGLILESLPLEDDVVRAKLQRFPQTYAPTYAGIFEDYANITNLPDELAAYLWGKNLCPVFMVGYGF
jgi:hypothetical protein